MLKFNVEQANLADKFVRDVFIFIDDFKHFSVIFNKVTGFWWFFDSLLNQQLPDDLKWFWIAF